MNRARILLGDDYALLLEAFKNLLEPEFDVVGTATDGWALLQKAEELKPDLIVLDVSMQLINGLEAGRKLMRILPDVKLIYLTINQDLDLVTHAFEIGALGYVLKSSSADELREAIRCGLLGRRYLNPMIAGKDGSFPLEPKPHQRPRRKNIIGLTSRQREVLQLLAEGLSMKEAAQILNISARTIAFHKYGMMRDFNIRSNAELFRLAVRQQVIA